MLDEEKFEKELKNMTWFKFFKWLVIICVVILFTTVIIGVFTTAGKVAKAPGAVLEKTLDANNIIQSYEWFYDVNAAYEAKLGQIKQFQKFYLSETDAAEKSRLRIEMAAVQQTCRDLVEKYNANSQKLNKSIFKGWSLPDTLNQQTCE